MPVSRVWLLTVDCWARLEARTGFNVLVASEVKVSASHWELSSFAGTGHFHVFRSGRGRWGDCGGGVSIGDGQWHLVSAVIEQSRLRSSVDGVLVTEAGTVPAEIFQGRGGDGAAGGLCAGGGAG